MAESDFSISITEDSVEVRHAPSVLHPHGKLHGFIFTISETLILACVLLFMPGKYGDPSMWHELVDAPLNSALAFWLMLLLFFVGLFGWHTLRYERAASPSDEILHCDREAITIKRVPWLDFSSRTWRTYNYPLAEVTKIRYAVIASTKATSIRGLRFRAHGRKWTLPGLKAAEAKEILTALRALGADAPDDPSIDERIKEAQAMQLGDTSWMDRSWMDHGK